MWTMDRPKADPTPPPAPKPAPPSLASVEVMLEPTRLLTRPPGESPTAVVAHEVARAFAQSADLQKALADRDAMALEVLIGMLVQDVVFLTTERIAGYLDGRVLDGIARGGANAHADETFRHNLQRLVATIRSDAV